MHELPPLSTLHKALPWPVSTDSWLGYNTHGRSRAVGPQQAPANLRLGLLCFCAHFSCQALGAPRPPSGWRARGPNKTKSFKPQQHAPRCPRRPPAASGRAEAGRLATERNKPPEKGVSRSALSKNRVFSGHGAERRSQKTLWTSFPDGKAAARSPWPGWSPLAPGRGERGGGPAAHTWSPGCCSCQRRGRGRMTGGLGRHNGLQGSTCPPPLPTPAWATPLGLGSSGEAVCRWAGAMASRCQISAVLKPQSFLNPQSRKLRHLFAIGRHLSCDNILFQWLFYYRQ